MATGGALPVTSWRVAVVEPVGPWWTVWSPLLSREKATGGGAGAVTVKVKLVVRLTPPPLPVTVMVEGPVGVDVVVERMREVAQVGVHAVGENEAVAPVGSPEVEKETACALPETSVAVMVLMAEAPWVTDWLPPLVREKSKEEATVL